MTSKTKKKLGQNLNKLFVEGEETKSKTQNSKNGLLVLNKGGSSLLQDAPAPVVAPDAWGRKKQQTSPPPVVETTPPKKPSPVPVMKTVEATKDNTAAASSPLDNNKANINGPSWDTYGGRGGGDTRGDGTRGGGKKGELVETAEYMSQKAKAKALEVQKEEQKRQQHQRRAASARLKELEAKANEKAQPPPAANEDVIHLNSYEDRGERPAANRMLFDPKSGSMVAVQQKKERKTSTRSSGEKKRGGGRSKENTPGADKKGKQKARNNRQRNNSNNNDTNNNNQGTGNNNKRSSRRGNKKSGKKVANNNEKITLFTGIDPQALENTGMLQQANHQQQQPTTPVFEVVTADDKMDLLTGVDDSPTLKPTAKAFAPSQAAMAAAFAAKNDSSEEEEEEEDDDDVDGLGFDPTLDMDGLIQSPSARKPESDFDFDSLTLDPPVEKPSLDGPRHIFAFGSSGTWGDAKPTNTDWKVPSGGLFGDSDVLAGFKPEMHSEEATPTTTTTGFLNLPPASSSTWGGFGGISATDHKMGD